MSVLLALIATSAVVTSDPIVFADRFEASNPIVHLSDIADLSSLPPSLREHAATVPVARLTLTEQTLSSRDIARRARAALPALTAWLPSDADKAIHIRWTRADAPVSSSVAASPALPVVQAGDQLTIRVNVGPVTVEREVFALQSARAGNEVFVRTPEGVVLRARLADDQ